MGHVKNPEFSGYDEMSSDELGELIQQEILSAAKADADKILYISSILVEREKDSPITSWHNAGESWKRFREIYLPMTEETPAAPVPSEEAHSSFLKKAFFSVFSKRK